MSKNHKPSPTKIAIIGGGNVGTFLAAAALSGEKNYALTIVENNEKRCDELRQYGVAYEAGNGDEKILVAIPPEKFHVSSSMIDTADIVFIATKSYQFTPQIYREEIAPFLHENSKIVLVQNGYPNPEILSEIGNKAVVQVVNAGFSLNADRTKTITNKSQIDLPYGSLSQALSREELESEIGQIFTKNPHGLSARYDENITEDIMKKTQYACIGAYCAVAAFLSSHPHDKKFTFGDLTNSQKEVVGHFTNAISTQHNSQTEENISAIVQEVKAIAELRLLSAQQLQERREINSNIENSLVTDARNGRKMERGIVDNLLGLAQAKNLETPVLQKLSQALRIIEEDGWKLEPKNIHTIESYYYSRSRI